MFACLFTPLTLPDPKSLISEFPKGGHKVPGLEKVSLTPSRHHPTPPRHHQKTPDTPQTHPRHPPDTTQTPPVTPRQHPDTTTHQPNSTWPPRHPSDSPQTPPRHPQTTPDTQQTPQDITQTSPRPWDTPRQAPDTIQTPPRHLPDTFFSCYHKRYIIIGKVKKIEDIVAIEKFWKSQYENDPGTKCPPLGLIGLNLCFSGSDFSYLIIFKLKTALIQSHKVYQVIKWIIYQREQATKL